MGINITNASRQIRADFQRGKQRIRRPLARPQFFCEALEGRLLFAYINWTNRGPDDGFDDTYGADAFAARQIVDVAIADWAFVIKG